MTSGVAGFGMSVQGPGDIDGDGVPDQMVSAPSWDDARGRMYAFSGATGELVMALDSPDPQRGARFGFQDVAPGSPGDVNGDGCAELYGNGFQHHGSVGRDEGRAWVLDGRTGKALYSLAAPVPIAGGQFGWSMARTDHDSEGRSDLYVGAAPHHFPGCDQSGGTWVFRGGDGALLETLSLPDEWAQPSSAENWGPNLGWSIAAPGDLDGDGRPDYVAGAPFTDVDVHQDQGLIVVFLSGG
ncbi:MAG TPA: integrin alpha [Acidimicrobiales bacterium]|nr:integrin alpha [Acidimicrobiales bacterium]